MDLCSFSDMSDLRAAGARQQADLPAYVNELRHYVLPLARPLIGDQLFAAEPPELARTELRLPLFKVRPQREVGHESPSSGPQTGHEERTLPLSCRRDALEGPGPRAQPL